MSTVTTLTTPAATATETVTDATNNVSTADAVEAEVTPNLVSDKKADWLIRTATEGATSPEDVYRKLIELTYADATVDTRKKIPYQEILANYAKSQTVLQERLYFARKVAYNTAKKMTHGLPEELNWVYSINYQARITGIFRGTAIGGREKDITAELAEGKTTIYRNDRVRFEIPSFNGTKFTGELPAYLLGNDPIAVAQYIREMGKSHHRAETTKAYATAKKDNVELAKKIKALQEQMDRNEQILAAAGK